VPETERLVCTTAMNGLSAETNHTHAVSSRYSLFGTVSTNPALGSSPPTHSHPIVMLFQTSSIPSFPAVVPFLPFFDPSLLLEIRVEIDEAITVR
jgi:hypothetical protein